MGCGLTDGRDDVHGQPLGQIHSDLLITEALSPLHPAPLPPPLVRPRLGDRGRLGLFLPSLSLRFPHVFPLLTLTLTLGPSRSRFLIFVFALGALGGENVPCALPLQVACGRGPRLEHPRLGEGGEPDSAAEGREALGSQRALYIQRAVL